MRCTLNKNKKKYKASLLVGMAVLGLTACNMPDQLFSDSGSNVIEQIDTSQYLDLAALEKAPEEQNFHGYDVYTLEYGTFETTIAGIKANINMLETSTVRAEVANGNMYLLELCVSRGNYVSKGDVIAKVSTETSDLDMEELQLKLTRLEEDYVKYLADYDKQHKEAVENVSVYELPYKIDMIEIQQMELDYTRRVKSYEEQLANYREQIQEQKELAAMKEIVAPQDGFVLSVSGLSVGQELKNGTEICRIAPKDKIVFEFTDETMHYGYGMDLTLSSGNWRFPTTYEVEVVSALGKTLYGSWNQTTSFVDGEYDIGELLEQSPYLVSGTTNVMENVILVPVDAVTQEGSKLYVNVLNEDGSLLKKQFISGGKNADNYWVFDGLEAGMQIIMEN